MHTSAPNSAPTENVNLTLADAGPDITLPWKGQGTPLVEARASETDSDTPTHSLSAAASATSKDRSISMGQLPAISLSTAGG